jgi:CubicO group peptidase (beta-lactamase class C family)
LSWCDRARFGVWSVTKSLLTEAALLHLAQKFGPEVFKAKIADYVPAARSYPAWADVTFDDCINMATGLGNGRLPVSDPILRKGAPRECPAYSRHRRLRSAIDER